MGSSIENSDMDNLDGLAASANQAASTNPTDSFNPANSVNSPDLANSIDSSDANDSTEPGEEPSAEECAALQAQNEHDALVAVFNDVRKQSTDGQLVEPARWAELGLIPEHLTSDEFEMFVYEYLEEKTAENAEADALRAADAPVYRTATKTVGVPQLFGNKPDPADAASDLSFDGADGGSSDALNDSESLDNFDSPNNLDDFDRAQPSNDNELGIVIPEGFELIELEREWTLVPLDEPDEGGEIDCNGIVVMVGERSYYLYARNNMTDAYARWSFLAVEDDRVATFVECVRNESRMYPRPMAATGLQNEPFNMTDAEVEETWLAVSGSGAYPDIGTTVASNGEVYYYSTEYLSDAYAKSLAEWHAVEREMYL